MAFDFVDLVFFVKNNFSHSNFNLIFLQWIILLQLSNLLSQLFRTYHFTFAFCPWQRFNRKTNLL